MNAAGVACMTIEELEEVKNSAAGTFVTKTATLEFRAGNPEPRYQDVPLVRSIRWGYLTKGWTIIWITYWSCKKRIQIGPSSYLSSACLLKRPIPSWKRCKKVILKVWQNWTFPAPMSQENLRSPMIWDDGSDLVRGLCLFHQTSWHQVATLFWYRSFWSSSSDL